MNTSLSPNQPQFDQLSGDFLQAAVVYALKSSKLDQDGGLENALLRINDLRKDIEDRFKKASNDPQQIVLLFLSFKSLAQAVHFGEKLNFSNHSTKSLLKLFEKVFAQTHNYYNDIRLNMPQVFESMVLDLQTSLRDKTPLYPNVSTPQKLQERAPVRIALRAPFG